MVLQIKGANKLLDHSIRQVMEKGIQAAAREVWKEAARRAYQAVGLHPIPVASQATCPQHKPVFRSQDPGLNLISSRSNFR